MGDSVHPCKSLRKSKRASVSPNRGQCGTLGFNPLPTPCHGLVLQVEGLFFVWAQIGMSVFVVAYFTVVTAHNIRDNNQFELRSVGAIQRRAAWPPR